MTISETTAKKPNFSVTQIESRNSLSKTRRRKLLPPMKTGYGLAPNGFHWWNERKST